MKQPPIVSLLEQLGIIPPSKQTLEQWITTAAAFTICLPFTRFG